MPQSFSIRTSSRLTFELHTGGASEIFYFNSFRKAGTALQCNHPWSKPKIISNNELTNWQARPLTPIIHYYFKSQSKCMCILLMYRNEWNKINSLLNSIELNWIASIVSARKHWAALTQLGLVTYIYKHYRSHNENRQEMGKYWW